MGEDTPHYHGHRDRLRQRFVESGPKALTDYELLELLLFRILPRRDTKPIAKAMIAKSVSTPAESNVYHYPEMMDLNR